MRQAVERVAAHQFDRNGQRTWQHIQGALDDEHVRLRIGQVSVPFGICMEPSNVKAGGHACPFRFRCPGCGHFRTDASYLPELKDHLNTLLRDRERVLAAGELDPWARTEAAPSDTEISKLRQLIHRVEASMDDLSDEGREQIKEAANALRRTPPGRRPRHACHRLLHRSDQERTPLMNTAKCLTDARRQDGERRRTMAMSALDQRAAHRAEIIVSAVARAAGVHRSLIYRHPDLHAAVTARAAAEPPPGTVTGPSASKQSLLADIANLTDRIRRQDTHIRHLEQRPAEALGEQVWQQAGLGGPPARRLAEARQPPRTAHHRTAATTRRPRRGPRRRPRREPTAHGRPQHLEGEALTLRRVIRRRTPLEVASRSRRAVSYLTGRARYSAIASARWRGVPAVDLRNGGGAAMSSEPPSPYTA